MWQQNVKACLINNYFLTGFISPSVLVSRLLTLTFNQRKYAICVHVTQCDGERLNLYFRELHFQFIFLLFIWPLSNWSLWTANIVFHYCLLAMIFSLALRFCLGFALLRSLIGEQNSLYFLNQWDPKPNWKQSWLVRRASVANRSTVSGVRYFIVQRFTPWSPGSKSLY